MSRLPASVVGGYLGAGKTTAINALLGGNHGRRLGVLVNDFGAVNVDVELIAGHDGDTLALANGCVCCRIDDDLGAAIERLRRQRPVLDHVLLEASGAADPERSLARLAACPGVRPSGIAVVVNGDDIRRRVRDRYVGRHVQRQLESADVLLVNRAAPGSLDAWLERYSGAPLTDVPQTLLDHLRSHYRPIGGAVGPHADFVTTRVPVKRSASVAQWRRWLAALPPTCLRAKGIVATDAGPMLVERAGGVDAVRAAPAGAGLTDVVLIASAQARLPPLSAP